MYINRDQNGKINQAFSRCQFVGQEYISDENEEYISYINPPETYIQKRLKNISDGGYGTINEQLEIMNEQGFEAWQAHCTTVKQNNPKPE